MTTRRLRVRRPRRRHLALLAGGLLAPGLLAGCGIRPTEVPVDAGAPASRTACPSEVLAPRAPGSAPATPGTAPGAAPASSATPSATPRPGGSAVPASPAPASPAPSGSPFVAPSPSHCA